ncbi:MULTISPECIES: AAA family ATPase [Cysteiniphilum]|uniref:ATP-binding protein n=1 Tax=Cysteiniphilum litorale TaxID=2056700 RepID=A0A8J2Z751_9GAMM|nr:MULTISPECIES: AAA family ATPase [Cysteiniphilum]GGG08818.1 ATP-binding protein [Cysteiniphilum litorale]
MNKFICTKQYKQFEEFCKACHRDRYIGLCYGTAGVGKTESAKNYTKWYRIETYREKDGRLNTGEKPKIQMGKLNSILYTPSVLNPPRDLIKEIRDAQRQFSLLKERYIYGNEIPHHARVENKNFAELIIIDEAERLKPQGIELLRELYDNGEANFIFVGMPGIEKMLQRFPQLYSRIGFVHQFKKLGANEVKFILQYHLSKINTDIKDDDFTDQEVVATIVNATNGNFRLINRLIKQSLRIMKVNCMTTITKEIVEAARSCLLVGEVS